MADPRSKQLKTPRRFIFAELKEKFVLTRKEKKVVIFILCAFVLGLGTKHYRDINPVRAPSLTEKRPQKATTKKAAHSKAPPDPNETDPR